MDTLFRLQGLIYNDMLCYPDREISAHETIFISGPSGSGKSTLLRLLNATLSPSAGEIYLKGKPLSGMDTIALRRRVILAGQSVYLFRGTVLENFQEYHKYHESQCPGEAEIACYLKICGAPFTPDFVCDTMSGGERQRVFLAIALSLLPEVLLFDEPTSALDSELAREILTNILRFCKEKKITPIIVSHDMALRDEFAQTIVEIGGDGQ